MNVRRRPDQRVDWPAVIAIVAAVMSLISLGYQLAPYTPTLVYAFRGPLRPVDGVEAAAPAEAAAADARLLAFAPHSAACTPPPHSPSPCPTAPAVVPCPPPPPPALPIAPGLLPPPQLLVPDEDRQPYAGGARPPSVCVIARTYAGKRSNLLAFAASLAVGRPPRLSVTFVDTDTRTPYEGLPASIEALNTWVFGGPVASLSPRTPRDRLSLFPQYKAEDHGYILTDLVLEDLLASRAEARGRGLLEDDLPCAYFLVTNGDNVYGAQWWAGALGEAAAQRADVVGTHFVSHYDWPGSPIREPLWEKVRLYGQCGPWRPGRDVEVAANFKPACIDLGAALFSAAVLESSGARFIVDRLRAGNPTGRGINPMEADGEFFARLAALPRAKAVLVRRTLMMHQ
jgi:hypothetical protein